jgi:hypothetical protein
VRPEVVKTGAQGIKGYLGFFIAYAEVEHEAMEGARYGEPEDDTIGSMP